MPLPYFGFGTANFAEDGRRMRRVTDEANAIFADMFTLARPGMISTFARRNWAKQSGGQDKLADPPALRALKSEVPGNPAAAREVYRVDRDICDTKRWPRPYSHGE